MTVRSLRCDNYLQDLCRCALLTEAEIIVDKIDIESLMIHLKIFSSFMHHTTFFCCPCDQGCAAVNLLRAKIQTKSSSLTLIISHGWYAYNVKTISLFCTPPGPFSAGLTNNHKAPYRITGDDGCLDDSVLSAVEIERRFTCEAISQRTIAKE